LVKEIKVKDKANQEIYLEAEYENSPQPRRTLDHSHRSKTMLDKMDTAPREVENSGFESFDTRIAGGNQYQQQIEALKKDIEEVNKMKKEYELQNERLENQLENFNKNLDLLDTKGRGKDTINL
jgi:hypothetical protein